LNRIFPSPRVDGLIANGFAADIGVFVIMTIVQNRTNIDEVESFFIQRSNPRQWYCFEIFSP
jgi:hypothetical protein